MPKTLSLLSSLLLFSLRPAAAGDCTVGAELVHDYGISFAGFARDIPPAPPTLPQARRQVDVFTAPLHRTPDWVKDGFEHRALVNRRLKLALILRTGGFGGVHEWYGPVPVHAASLDGCIAPPPESPASAR